MLRELLRVLALVTAARAGAPPRFFIMGDGHLAIVNAHTDEHVTVRYRREDGTYDPDALARLRRVFRSSGDAREQDVSLRLIEVLSHVQKMAGGGSGRRRRRGWTRTSRQENARMFARTEFDRYVGGEPITVTLHALTVPPVRVARVAKLLGDGGGQRDLRVEGEGEGCLEAASTGARFRVSEAPPRWPGASRAHDLRVTVGADARDGRDERHRSSSWESVASS